jgi:hypothetical protein
VIIDTKCFTVYFFPTSSIASSTKLDDKNYTIALQSLYKASEEIEFFGISNLRTTDQFRVGSLYNH